jgi:hypothetical protein
MIRVVFGLFLVLHGLVHLLYFGQSARYFELQPGMTWPDGSWAFTTVLGNAGARSMAGVLLVLAAAGFVAGGAGLLFIQPWGRPVVVVAATLSSLIYLLFWDGGLQSLDNKGGIGILINLGVLAALLLFGWPKIAQ